MRLQSGCKRIYGLSAFLVLGLAGCLPASSTTQASPTPNPTVSVQGPKPATATLLPSSTPWLTPSTMLPGAVAGPPLMFVTQEDDGISLRLTDPPVGFARSDGEAIPPPTWAEGLGRVGGYFLTWSSDGRYLAFDGLPIDETGEPADRMEAAQTPHLILDAIAGRFLAATPEGYSLSVLAGGPTWSPDGTRLAVPFLSSAAPKARPSLFLMTPGEESAEALTPPGALFPSWSPVDNRIAYLEYLPADPLCGPLFPVDRLECDQATLKLVDVDSGAVSTVLDGVHMAVEAGGWQFAYNAPVWSPDGQWLVVFRGGSEPDLVAVNPRTGEQRVLSRAVVGGAFPAISPDGSTVAFTSRASGNDDIILVPLNHGSEKNLTNHSSIDSHPVWSPDGHFIAFLSDRAMPGGSHLYTIDLLTGEVRRVSQDFVFTRPAWVPDTAPE